MLERLDHRIVLGGLRRFLQLAVYVAFMRAMPYNPAPLMLHVPILPTSGLRPRAQCEQSSWSMLVCASRRLAIEQLLFHMVREDVLYNKSSINILLIACLMEYAGRFTRDVRTNKPSQAKLLFSTRTLDFSCTWQKQLLSQLGWTNHTKPLVPIILDISSQRSE